MIADYINLDRRPTRLPVRLWRDVAYPPLLHPIVTVDDAGVARVASDGEYRAYLDVSGVILRGKDTTERATARARLADILRLARAGQRIQMWVNNTPTDAWGVAAALDRAEDADGALHDVIRAGRHRWLGAEMARTYMATARYLLVIAGRDKGPLLARREDIARLLGVVGAAVRPLVRAEVEALTRLPAALDGLRAGAVVVDGEWRTTLWVRAWAATVSFDDLLSLPLLPVRSTLSITARGRDQAASLAWLEGQATRMRASDLNKRRAIARSTVKDGLVLITQEQGDVALQRDAAELDALYLEARAGRAALVDVGVALTLHAPDSVALEDAVDAALTALRPLGFTVEPGLEAQAPLYRASLPLALAPYRPLALTDKTASALFPFVKEAPGPADGILLGRTERGGQLAFFDWGQTAADVVAILADQGMGKSYVMGLLLDATLRRQGWVTVLDPVGSFTDLIEGHGGVEAELLAPGVSINLLDLARRSKGDPTLIMLDNFQILFGYDLTSAGDDAILEQGLRAVYAAAARRAARGWDGTPRLRYLAAWLRGQERKARAANDQTEAQACRKLYQRMRSYYGHGSFASLMDYPTTVDLETSGLILNTARFAMNEAGAARLSAVVATTTADLRTALAERAGTYAVTALDEGYGTIKQSGPWLQGRGRRNRHERTKVLLATHMVEDLANDPETRKIMTAIKIYFVGCTQSGRAALIDHLRFPARLVERAPDLRRTDERAEFVYLVRPPDRAPEYAVIHVKLVPELAYTLGSYGPQKDQRARDIARYGSVADAARAFVAGTDETGGGDDKRVGVA